MIPQCQSLWGGYLVCLPVSLGGFWMFCTEGPVSLPEAVFWYLDVSRVFECPLANFMAVSRF